MKYKLISSQKVNNEFIFEVVESPSNFLEKLLKKTKNLIVRGRSTVWNFYPSGKRCSTNLEEIFAGWYKREKWKEEDSKPNTDISLNERN